MSRFFGRWVSLSVAAAVMIWLLPNIQVVGDNTAIAVVVFVLFLALVNASIRPILHALSLPITILTLGLSAFAINILCLHLASELALSTFQTGIVFTDTLTAILGSIVLAIVSSIVSKIIG